MLSRADTHRKGFTLVEVIVALVVLGLLAAIAVPAMTGWIDQAREKQLFVDCRACVDAATTLAVTRFDSGGGAQDISASEVKKLAEVSGTVSNIRRKSARSAEIQTLTYTENGRSVTYYADGPKYLLGGGGFASGTQISQAVNDLYDIMKENSQITDKGHNTSMNVDSTATNGEVRQMTEEAVNALGFDGINIKSWAVRRESDTQDVVWVTDQDITQYKPGEKVRAIRYNLKTGNYTAGYALISTITENKATYNAFAKNVTGWDEYGFVKSGSNKNLQQDADKKNPDRIVEIFNGMPVMPEN